MIVMRTTFLPCSGVATQVTLLVCSIGLHLSCAASSSCIHYPMIVGWTRLKGSLDSLAGWTRRKGSLDSFAGWTRLKGSLDSLVSDALAGWPRHKGSLDSFAGWTRRKGSLDSFVSDASAGWTRLKGSLALSLSPVLLFRSCVPSAKDSMSPPSCTHGSPPAHVMFNAVHHRKSVGG